MSVIINRIVSKNLNYIKIFKTFMSTPLIAITWNKYNMICFMVSKRTFSSIFSNTELGATRDKFTLEPEIVKYKKA